MNPKLLALLLGGASLVAGLVLTAPSSTAPPKSGTPKLKLPPPPPIKVKLPAPSPTPTPSPAPATADASALVSVAIPDRLRAGERARFTVVLKNTGTVEWDESFRLGTVDDLAADAARFLEAVGAEPNRVHLPAGARVAPGAEHAFAFDVAAPAVARTYVLRFRMVHEGVRWFGAIAERSVVVDPAPAAVARKGLVRADSHCVKDDGGAFSALGATLFWGAWGYKNDRPKLERALDALSKNGFDYVRCLGVVGDPNRPDSWDGREISALDPDHAATIAGLTDLAYDRYGLRIEWTLIGDGQITVPSSAEKYALVDRFLAMSKGREHKIMHFEIANEAWQNGFPGSGGRDELRALTKYMNDRTDVLVAASASDGDPAELYRGGIADLITIHFDRDSSKTEGAWRPVRQPWEFQYLADVPSLASNNEPIGPGSSVASDEDPVRLASGAAVSYVAGVGLHVFHARSGIRGLPTDREMADVPGIGAFKIVRGLLPADLPNWAHKNGHWADSPFRFYARDPGGTPHGDAMWPDFGGGSQGAVRCYSGVRGNDFVTCPIGVQGTLTIEARRPMSFEVFDVGTGASVGKWDLSANEKHDLVGAAAYVIRGTYR